MLAAIQDTKHNQRQEQTPPIHWKGVLLMKDPFSLASYPMLLQELRPRTVIELGAFQGGSAVWLADLLDVFEVADSSVHSFDIDTALIRADHPSVTFHYADSTRPETYSRPLLESLPHPWLVIEDAHTNVFGMLTYLDGLLHTGDYVVVEDVGLPNQYGGPYQDMKRFLSETDGQYLIDTRYTDLFGYNVTWHVNGYIRKMHD